MRQGEGEEYKGGNADQMSEGQGVPGSAQKSDRVKYMQYISDDVITYYTPMLFEIIDSVFS